MSRLRLLSGPRIGWHPLDIPRSLKYSEWDFEQTPRMTLVGSAISAFAEPVTGASFSQASSGARPLLDATAFNGRQCAVFDGTDDFLRNTTALATLGWPTSGAFEVWCLAECLSGGGANLPFAYPDSSTGNYFYLANTSTAGVRRWDARVGQGGGSQVTVSNTTNAGLGRTVVRCVYDGASIRLDVNGVQGTPSAAVMSLSSGPRNTIGAFANNTPSNYFNGRLNFMGFYKPLPERYADNLYAYLNIRKG